MKKLIITTTNERIIPAGGLAVVGAILGKSDFVKKANRRDVTPNRAQHQINNGDVFFGRTIRRINAIIAEILRRGEADARRRILKLQISSEGIFFRSGSDVVPGNGSE